MADEFEDVDLSHDPCDVRLVLDLLLLEYLDGDLLLRQLMDALPHLSKGTGADCLAHQVVPDESVINLIIGLLVPLSALTTVTFLGRHLLVFCQGRLEGSLQTLPLGHILLLRVWLEIGSGRAAR